MIVNLDRLRRGCKFKRSVKPMGADGVVRRVAGDNCKRRRIRLDWGVCYAVRTFVRVRDGGNRLRVDAVLRLAALNFFSAVTRSARRFLRTQSASQHVVTRGSDQHDRD